MGDRRPRATDSRTLVPAAAGRITLAGQERGHFVEWKADDVAIGARDLDEEAAGDALRGIAAGLAAPFGGGEIGLDVVLREALEAHARLDQALAVGLFRR